MVFYNTRVHSDFDKIRIGLLNWEKVILTEEFVINYIRVIKQNKNSRQNSNANDSVH